MKAFIIFTVILLINIYNKLRISGGLYTLIKQHHLCGPSLVSLGTAGSVTTTLECALLCRAHATCQYFSYAKWFGPNEGGSGNCYYINTAKPNCPEGFQEDLDYDFYGLNGKIYDT